MYLRMYISPCQLANTSSVKPKDVLHCMLSSHNSLEQPCLHDFHWIQLTKHQFPYLATEAPTTVLSIISAHIRTSGPANCCYVCYLLKVVFVMSSVRSITDQRPNLAITVRGPLKWWKSFPALSPFQSSADSNDEIRSLIRPWLISLRTWLIGVPNIELQAVILLKI